MASIPVCEVAVHLKELRNVDLFHQGLYRIHLQLYHEQPLCCEAGGGGTGAATATDQLSQRTASTQSTEQSSSGGGTYAQHQLLQSGGSSSSSSPPNHYALSGRQGPQQPGVAGGAGVDLKKASGPSRGTGSFENSRSLQGGVLAAGEGNSTRAGPGVVAGAPGTTSNDGGAPPPTFGGGTTTTGGRHDSAASFYGDYNYAHQPARMPPPTHQISRSADDHVGASTFGTGYYSRHQQTRTGAQTRGALTTLSSAGGPSSNKSGTTSSSLLHADDVACSYAGVVQMLECPDDVVEQCILPSTQMATAEGYTSWLSRAFLIRYCDEEVELHEGAVFRLEVPEGGFLTLEVELLFADLTALGGPDAAAEMMTGSGFDPLAAEFKSVSRRKLLLHQVQRGLFEFVPLLFDEFHFCLLRMHLFAGVVDVRRRVRCYGVLPGDTRGPVGAASAFGGGLGGGPGGLAGGGGGSGTDDADLVEQLSVLVRNENFFPSHFTKYRAAPSEEMLRGGPPNGTCEDFASSKVLGPAGGGRAGAMLAKSRSPTGTPQEDDAQSSGGQGEGGISATEDRVRPHEEDKQAVQKEGVVAPGPGEDHKNNVHTPSDVLVDAGGVVQSPQPPSDQGPPDVAHQPRPHDMKSSARRGRAKRVRNAAACDIELGILDEALNTLQRACAKLGFSRIPVVQPLNPSDIGSAMSSSQRRDPHLLASSSDGGSADEGGPVDGNSHQRANSVLSVNSAVEFVSSATSTEDVRAADAERAAPEDLSAEDRIVSTQQRLTETWTAFLSQLPDKLQLIHTNLKRIHSSSIARYWGNLIFKEERVLPDGGKECLWHSSQRATSVADFERMTLEIREQLQERESIAPREFQVEDLSLVSLGNPLIFEQRYRRDPCSYLADEMSHLLLREQGAVEERVVGSDLEPEHPTSSASSLNSSAHHLDTSSHLNTSSQHAHLRTPMATDHRSSTKHVSSPITFDHSKNRGGTLSSPARADFLFTSPMIVVGAGGEGPSLNAGAAASSSSLSAAASQEPAGCRSVGGAELKSSTTSDVVVVDVDIAAVKKNGDGRKAAAAATGGSFLGFAVKELTATNLAERDENLEDATAGTQRPASSMSPHQNKEVTGLVGALSPTSTRELYREGGNRLKSFEAPPVLRIGEPASDEDMLRTAVPPAGARPPRNEQHGSTTGQLVLQQEEPSHENVYGSAPESHLIVLVHGLHGNPYDLRMIKNAIVVNFPEVYFLCAGSNEDKTEGDIWKMGERLFEEVDGFVRDNLAAVRPDRLSFVGHSMGGLIVRAALPLLRPKYEGCFYSYISLSTMHLGLSYTGNRLVEAGVWVLKKWRQSEALRQLSLSDVATKTATAYEDLKGTFLYRLSVAPGLELFQHVVLLSSWQDQYAPFDSARAEVNAARMGSGRDEEDDHDGDNAAPLVATATADEERERAQGGDVDVGRVVRNGVDGDTSRDHDLASGSVPREDGGSASDGRSDNQRQEPSPQPDTNTTSATTTAATGRTSPAAKTRKGCELNDNTPVGRITAEMAQNIMAKVDPEKLLRLNVNFYLPEQSLDALIGRAAHIQFLENQTLMKVLVVNYPHLFA